MKNGCFCLLPVFQTSRCGIVRKWLHEDILLSGGAVLATGQR
jgi:hypothetical protein